MRSTTGGVLTAYSESFRLCDKVKDNLKLNKSSDTKCRPILYSLYIAIQSN